MENEDRMSVGGIEHWYFSNCDGDWEHQYGVTIASMDNPGWDVQIDIAETVLSGLKVSEKFEGERTPRELQPANGYDASFDWYEIWVENDVYRAYCSPKRLGYVLDRFHEAVREAEVRLGSLERER